MSAELLRAVGEQGYSEPTPIQSQAIPLVLQGKDLLAGAQTGTGKTASFALPVLQRLCKRAGSAPRALILAPTRELAAQVEESFRVYGKHAGLRSAIVYGGVGFDPQVKALKRGVDILVATPGRLLDHVQQRTVDLSRVEILVLDEADRMLDLGFIRDIKRILALLPRERQNLLFSATFSVEVRALAASFMQMPAHVEAQSRNGPDELVAQVAHPVDQARKRELLQHLITTGEWRQVLVFTRTKHGANRLAEQLARAGITADAIHGNKSQSRRTRSLGDFKRGNLRVLVATDIAARGLDIDQLPHVVNFDLPHVPEDYVHRIGRTGRAGNPGEAVSLVAGEEKALMAGIERLVKRRIERKVVAGFEPGRRGIGEADVELERAPSSERAPRRFAREPRVGAAKRPQNRANGNRTADAQQPRRPDNFGNRDVGARRVEQRRPAQHRAATAGRRQQRDGAPSGGRSR